MDDFIAKLTALLIEQRQTIQFENIVGRGKRLSGFRSIQSNDILPLLADAGLYLVITPNTTPTVYPETQDTVPNSTHDTRTIGVIFDSTTLPTITKNASVEEHTYTAINTSSYAITSIVDRADVLSVILTPTTTTVNYIVDTDLENGLATRKRRGKLRTTAAKRTVPTKARWAAFISRYSTQK
jgi:hypothetical protein